MSGLSALINSHSDPLLRKILLEMNSQYKAAFDAHGHKESGGTAYTSRPSAKLGVNIDDADGLRFPE